jgi:hypothetical protein
MHIPPFDELSRLAARAELSKTLLTTIAVGLQGLFGAFGTRAQAQPALSPCDYTALNRCFFQETTGAEVQLAACMTACQTLTDSSQMSLECAACAESFTERVGDAIRACHRIACGGRNEYCPSSGSIRPSICCPLGSRASFDASAGWVCRAGCGYQCAHPYVLDDEFCVCVCDPRLGACP